MKKRQAIFRNVHEKNDPTPMKSGVAFKKPLSAHQRVQRALRTHEILKRLEAQPGDEGFDSPPYEELTPHQLIVDPETGEEMTAGEHVMLQTERHQAQKDVEAYRASQARKAARQKLKKPADSKLSAGTGEKTGITGEPLEPDDGE